MSPSRYAGLLLSLCLAIVAQHSVVPAERPDGPALPQDTTKAVVEQTEPFGTIVSTIYDVQEKLWKRWRAVRTHVSGISQLVIRIDTSSDGKNWVMLPDSAFSGGADENAWDRLISSPVVVYNAKEPAGRRFLLWYAGAPSTGLIGGVSQGCLGLATSSDGRTFDRLPGKESPYAVSGMVLRGKDAFPTNKDITEATLGAPHVSTSPDGYQLTFYKVGFNGNGRMVDAGIGHADSKDGSSWRFLADEPVAVRVVGNNVSADSLIGRLQRLAAAYAEQQQL